MRGLSGADAGADGQAGVLGDVPGGTQPAAPGAGAAGSRSVDPGAARGGASEAGMAPVTGDARLISCPRCQHENAADAAFCDECGARLDTACPSCGEPNRAGAKFCRKCGQGLTRAAGASPAPASKFTAPESCTPKHLAEKI